MLLRTDRGMTSPSVHLERPDAGAAVVDGGGQQGLPALRVVLVRQLSGAQFDVQDAVSAQDGPEGEESVTSNNVKPSLFHEAEKYISVIR